MKHPRKTMEQSHQRIKRNGVKEGRRANCNAFISPGRENCERRAVPVRHHATADSVCEQQADAVKQKATVCNRNKMRVGTWNVRTLLQAGKSACAFREMNRLGVDVMGLSEVRWPDVGEHRCESGVLIYSGGQKGEKGVGVMLNKKMASCIKGYWTRSDRVILVKLNGAPFDLNIIQVYAPTCDGSEEEVNQFYGELSEVMEQCKRHEINIVMGDLNSKVGRGRDGDVVGPWGLGDRNERGDEWVEWCNEHQQIVLNTWFRNHPRKLWTWKSPGGRYKNQIDYVTINRRFRSAVTQVRTYPGADCDSDHVPVVAEVRVKLKKVNKPKYKVERELRELKKNEQVREQFNIAVRSKYEVLIDQCEEEGPDQLWDSLSTALRDACQEVVPERRKRRRGNRWITEEIFALMDERRRNKNINENRYKYLNRQVKRECNKAKEEWLNKECEEIESLSSIDTQLMYSRIAEVTGKRKWKIGKAVKSREGRVLMENDEIKERWFEYVGELFQDEREERRPAVIVEEGRPIMTDEIRCALRKMKNGKAVGEDGVCVEMLEAMGEFAIEKLTVIANQIYETGTITKQMRRSVFITIPKIDGTLDCKKHRTISIISQIAKIILRVVMQRVVSRIRREVAPEQYGFIPGKGTTNALFVMRNLMERMIEKQKDVYMCFIDYEKAFDRVRHGDLMKILDEVGIGARERRVISNLYWEQEAAVRVGEELTEYQGVARGVRQGCVMSPDLFNLYSEMVMRQLQDIEGIKIGGYNINNVRYADDTVLVADDAEKLQELVSVVVRASEERGLTVNKEKTKVMVASKSSNTVRVQISVNDATLEQVNSFKYLGSVLTEECRCTTEIKKRVGIAKTAFIKMRNFLTSRKVSVLVRRRAVKTYIWSILLYGAEAWTINKEMEKRLEAMEMWLWRRMMKVSWVERKSNEEVLRMVGVKRELMRAVRVRQMRFLGHVMRRGEIENVVLTGLIDGRRARGRPRETFMCGIKRALRGRLSCARILQATDDRERWRSMVAEVQEDMARR